MFADFGRRLGEPSKRLGENGGPFLNIEDLIRRVPEFERMRFVCWRVSER